MRLSSSSRDYSKQVCVASSFSYIIVHYGRMIIQSSRQREGYEHLNYFREEASGFASYTNDSISILKIAL